MSTGVYYSQSQQTTMATSIARAGQALAAGNYSAVMSALSNYYATQIYVPDANGNPTSTVMRGYAEAASQVINDNTPYGQVANQAVKNAVGSSDYTEAYQANLAFQLAKADYHTISNNGYQVPTLSDVANEHLQVYEALSVPGGIAAWGGTAFAALGQDFTLGKL